MFVKAPRLSPGNLSKALLKAREAQIIFVKPDLVSEATWENDGRHGMDMLNERCEGNISPGVDIDSVVFEICSRLAPVQTGMKTKMIAKIDGIMDQVIETNQLRMGFKRARTE